MVADLAGALDPRRFQVEALFLSRQGPLVQMLADRGVAAFAVGLRPDLASRLDLLRRARASRPAIIHQHAGGPRLSRALKWVTSARLVLHVHGSIDEASLQPSRVDARAARADALVACSHSVARHIAPTPSRVIYAGVAPARTVARDRGTGPVFGAAGRFVAVKGFDCLLRAFAAVVAATPGARLEICGDGPLRGDLEVLARRLGCGHAVTFLGWRQDYPALASGWDVFIQPSREEGFGVALLEAMAQGLPAVASDVGGIPELVEPGVTGWLVPPGDDAALERALLESLRTPSASRRMGDAARASAARFSAEAMALQTAALYEELLAA
jgi:glycosyltransferase involved in cell wall biosynthesis